MLARQASYDKKTLAQKVIPLAPGYRTALLSRPVHLYSLPKVVNIHVHSNIFDALLLNSPLLPPRQ